MRELLPVAALRFCGDATRLTGPYEVLRSLDAALRDVRITEALHVLGAWHWPSTNPTDPRRWVDGKTFFMLDKMDSFKSEYLADVIAKGISPTTILARRKSAPYTLTEAMRESRPTGESRWLILLYRKHGIRDVLYCPFTRWTIGYWSSQLVDPTPEMRALLGMAANAAAGRIESLKRYPEMMAKRQLSAREVEVLQFASTGLTAGEIAVKLGITTKTTQHYLENACRKLDAKNIAHAVSEAIRQGLII